MCLVHSSTALRKTMAETRVTQGAQPETVPAEPKKKSPVRTLILFAILLLVIGAYAHDYFVAAPAARAAHENIQKLVDERNAQGVKSASLVTSEDIQQAIGKQPSKVDDQKNYTVEVYRYWGGMLPQRQYISVLYLGEEKPRRHHVHYLNSMPFEEDYPSETELPADSKGDAKSDGTNKGPGPDGAGSEDQAPGASDDSGPMATEAPGGSETSVEPATPSSDTDASAPEETPAADDTEAAPE